MHFFVDCLTTWNKTTSKLIATAKATANDLYQ